MNSLPNDAPPGTWSDSPGLPGQLLDDVRATRVEEFAGDLPLPPFTPPTGGAVAGAAPWAFGGAIALVIAAALWPRPEADDAQAVRPPEIQAYAGPAVTDARRPELTIPSPPPAPSAQPGDARSQARTDARSARPRPAKAARSELELMIAIRKQTKSDPRAALGLIRESNRRFPAGMFRRDRAAHEVFALVALGRTQEAVRRGEAFLKQHPRDPLADAVRRRIAGL